MSISIGELLGEQIIEQAREKGVGLVTQPDYEAMLDKSLKARTRLPCLKKKLRREQNRFSSLPIVRKVNFTQKAIDSLFKELDKVKAQNGNTGKVWKEIKALKREITEMRNTRTFRRGVAKLNHLKSQITSHANDISCGNVDERRAYFDKKPNSPKLAHGWHETIRKGRNQGHGQCKKHCDVCKDMREAERSLNFFRDGDVKFAVSLM